MRCFSCYEFSLTSFCDSCQKELLEYSLGIRELEGKLKVYYFYQYENIKHLLYSKHKFHGYFILNALAKLSFYRFKDFFQPSCFINAIALDDKTHGAYSHTAILAKYLKTKFVKPMFNTLQSKSNIKYSGQTLEFRKTNKRLYELKKIPKYPVILVDDVVTTGLSLLQAKEILEKNNIEVLFALVLANAKE
ncbi:ComF family protein [Campylobacter insulaenigrae]|uniref:Transformation system, predicted amidophosphoribosyltransferase CtsW n=1 Tax=Campylobacter insulaenigrae NCTC 12927 TaxID=1031564 RepID=A0A0A8H318_9BACT|nr:ComF family protein [Campylobacter insulaenigrae]AJC88065.1 transformation system, predicted amidophosphoribosyltransferase CtsW [Campylobacter insulaenigrae NCTC 12927]MCR6575638.1 ComF family protein [Campylobacter insulaenigrae]MCR6583199.1 ComF family protein [Campylobacter insulaenigrae]MCR6584147.1 ComF family protein [Campylobacter insulaenigrae]MCR6587819.1 ComF family protein [Campylobacter insulaenigrae]